MRSAAVRTPSSLDFSAASSRQDVVTMQWPELRSASIDSPTQPSIARTIGMTSSRT